MTDVDRQIAKARSFSTSDDEQALLQRKRRRRGTGLAKRAGADRHRRPGDHRRNDHLRLVLADRHGWGAAGLCRVDRGDLPACLRLAPEAPVAAEKLVEVPLKALPQKTEQWLGDPAPCPARAGAELWSTASAFSSIRSHRSSPRSTSASRPRPRSAS